MSTASLPASWLFVRNDQSIWVVRPLRYTMIVSGPGRTGARHEFASDEEIERFQTSMAEELTNAGWMLIGVGRDRRGGSDRRGSGREVPGRRREDGRSTLQRTAAAAET
jgi:hypothetical protein